MRLTLVLDKTEIYWLFNGVRKLSQNRKLGKANIEELEVFLKRLHEEIFKQTHYNFEI